MSDVYPFKCGRCGKRLPDPIPGDDAQPNHRQHREWQCLNELERQRDAAHDAAPNARAAERAAIVAWLRKEPPGLQPYNYANAIERGEHMAPSAPRESPAMCETSGCGRPIPIGGEGCPEICPKCIDEERARESPAVALGALCCCGHPMHEGRVCKAHLGRSASRHKWHCLCDGHNPNPEDAKGG